MKKNIALLLCLVFFLGGGEGIFAQTIPLATSSAPTLQDLIDQKSAQLQALQAQRNALEQTIQSTSQAGASLKNELKQMDANINQLNLSIQANKITLDKLNLQIQQMSSDIQDTSSAIEGTKTAIKQLFVELQQSDQENLLTMILKNESLSESVDQFQSLVTLNKALMDNIQNLENYQVDLATQINDQKQIQVQKQVENVNLANRQIIVQEQKSEKQQVLAQTQDQEQVYRDQLQKIVQQQLAISSEVEKIEADLRKNINPSLLPIPRPGVLAAPVIGPMTQGYGYTKFAKNGYRGHFHNGIDIGVPIGTPVQAPDDAIVVATGNQDKYCYRAAYGKFIVLKHPDNLVTLYGHLSQIIVTKGESVKKGDIIGYSGRTGYATGPHLHFTVYAGPTFYMGSSNGCGSMPYGGDLDPTQYLDMTQFQ